MNTYTYKARDRSGKAVEGVMGAESEKAVAARLAQMQCIPILISPVQSSRAFAFGRDSFRPRIRLADLNMFTRQMFTLQKAGLTILAGLNAIKQQTTRKGLQDAVAQMMRDIESGSDFSSALEQHPRIFGLMYVNMVRAGEVSGKLVEVLERLAVLGEHEEKVQLRIQSALRYPMFVVGALLLGFLVLITTVIPRFAKLYSRFTVELPLPTRLLIGLNYAVTHFGWLIVLVLIAAALLFRHVINTKNGRWAWDNFKLNVYVFGQLVLKLAMSRFCRTTGMLLRSGVPLMQILDIVSTSVGNVVIAKAIRGIRESVNEGKGMQGPMKASGLFPPIVTQMVAVGEETGKLDELLLHVSDYYDTQIEHTVDNLVSLIEPLLILILGMVVLVMALAIFMPMWGMMKLFHH